MFWSALPGAIALGLIWGIMAIGVYITYKVLDFADLTVDGSICTGGAVCAAFSSALGGGRGWLCGVRLPHKALPFGYAARGIHKARRVPHSGACNSARSADNHFRAELLAVFYSAFNNMVYVARGRGNRRARAPHFAPYGLSARA